MTIVEFLQARLADDAAHLDVIRTDAETGRFFGIESLRDGSYYHFLDRAPAEVEAKRRIVARYEDAIARSEDPDYSTVEALDQIREYEDWVLPALALPYADHPDYNPTWSLS